MYIGPQTVITSPNLNDCLPFQPLRRALTKMGASAPLLQSLIPDTQDNSLSFSVLNYLKRLKNQAKIEFEKLCADVINKASSNNNQKVIIFLSSFYTGVINAKEHLSQCYLIQSDKKE